MQINFFYFFFNCFRFPQNVILQFVPNQKKLNPILKCYLHDRLFYKTTNYEPNRTMYSSSSSSNESTYGNEVKRRRINQAGDHLKVWQVCSVEYMTHDKKEKAEMKPVQESVYEVQEPVQEVQEPVQEVQEPVQVQEPPVQLVGRTVILETRDQGICRGTIQSLFELNGERAIHIQTDDGQNLIYTTSQICAACVLHTPPEEEVLSPIPRNEDEEVVRHEVVQIDSDDDDEVQELTRRI